LKKLISLIAFFFLVACSGKLYIHKNTATLSQDQKVKVLASGALDIYKINGELVDLRGEKGRHADSTIYLAPGQYSFILRYQVAVGSYSKGYLLAEGDLVAGKTYRIAYYIFGRLITVYIKEVLEQKNGNQYGLAEKKNALLTED